MGIQRVEANSVNSAMRILKSKFSLDVIILDIKEEEPSVSGESLRSKVKILFCESGYKWRKNELMQFGLSRVNPNYFPISAKELMVLIEEGCTKKISENSPEIDNSSISEKFVSDYFLKVGLDKSLVERSMCELGISEEDKESSAREIFFCF